ncbi:MAG: hypothetical protein EXS67_01275 [Candidatus Margulisbacteria bacterium]|nr:hypothetical protein [Candidatus Margulisiibacteriota bacterium]
MNGIQLSPSSFYNNKPVDQSSALNQINQILSEVKETDMPESVRMVMTQILDGLRTMAQNPNADTSFESASSVAELFLDVWAPKAAEDEAEFGADLKKEFPEFRSAGRSMILTKDAVAAKYSLSSGKGQNAKSSIFSGGTMAMASREELEEMVRGILKGGIEDMKELRDLMVLMGMLGMHISVNLLSEIKECLKEFLNELSKLTGDLGDFLKVLQSIKDLVGPLLGDDAVDSHSLVQQNFDLAAVDPTQDKVLTAELEKIGLTVPAAPAKESEVLYFEDPVVISVRLGGYYMSMFDRDSVDSQDVGVEDVGALDASVASSDSGGSSDGESSDQNNQGEQDVSSEESKKADAVKSVLADVYEISSETKDKFVSKILDPFTKYLGYKTESALQGIDDILGDHWDQNL